MSRLFKYVKNNEHGPYAQTDKEWFPGYIVKEKSKLWKNMDSGLPYV